MKRIIVFIASLLLSHSVWAQNLSVSTNLLGYLDMGTMSLNASYGLSRHLTAEAGAKYNPFVFQGKEDVADRMQSKQRTFSAGFRYWPWHIHSGWWLSGKGQFQEYNTGGVTDALTSEGDRIGIGLGCGYTYMLSPHLNLEAGAGFWGGYESYVVYECPHCGQVVSSGDRNFALPNELLLALVFVF